MGALVNFGTTEDAVCQPHENFDEHHAADQQNGCGKDLGKRVRAEIFVPERLGAVAGGGKLCADFTGEGCDVWFRHELHSLCARHAPHGKSVWSGLEICYFF